MNVEASVLELLACPACRGKLADDAPAPVLRCLACARRYPVEEGIPVLLADRALPPEEPAK